MTTTAVRRPSSDAVRRVLRGSGILTIGIMVMNASTFGFQFIAARLLGPEQYGGVASMMSLLVMIAVFQLGLQATAARRVSTQPDRVREIEHATLRVTYRAAVGLGLILLVLSPVVWKLLRLESLTPAILIAVATVPLTVMGGQAGILQGERRWRALALLYLANGVPRLVIGAIVMAIRPTEAAAMAAVALGQCVPVFVGAWALRRSARERSSHERMWPVITETLHGSFALMAFFVLSSIDILLARNVLDAHEAGLYAGGLILTKVVLFLPQVVVIVAFPAMSNAAERARTLVVSVAVVLGVGVCSTLGAWLLAPIATFFIGGEEYAAVESRLWLFAILGTLLAVLQLLVYSVLARQHRSAALLIWVAVGAVVVAALQAGSLQSLVLAVTIIDAVLVVILLAISFAHLRQDSIGD